ncbi:hypothetical protein B0T11DRAFT_329719 [Plectosphaerella cucumerina]|uniref:Uncharacterized protein n=1 Tax=Plectosphaerella cucumerina TaxID=40658 RepID=A0A8K0TG49_9PEZI|nr:hypothetical protein B0T11DRAFT_329719 [Plectosphaerella cucumerina]
MVHIASYGVALLSAVTLVSGSWCNYGTREGTAGLRCSNGQHVYCCSADSLRGQISPAYDAAFPVWRSCGNTAGNCRPDSSTGFNGVASCESTT